MTNEIKQILDYLKIENGHCSSELSYEETHLLLDYITNLQQENQDNMKCIKSIKEQLESVINENQRLLNKWFENNDKMVELIGEKEVYNESLKDYKSRCEKADEYIKKHIEKCNINGYEGKFDNFDIFTKPQKLLNILNGRSDE